MSRPLRKGVFQQTAPNIAVIPERQEAIADNGNTGDGSRSEHQVYRTMWNRGNGAAPELVEVDLGAVVAEPLLASRIGSIAEIFRNVSPATAMGYRKRLLAVVRYIEWYRENFGAAPETIDECTARFTNLYIIWRIEGTGNIGQKAADTRIFLRVMTALEVPAEMLPANPFPDDGVDGEDVADTLSPAEIRALLKQAKFEAGAIINRTREAHRLAASGVDPRRSGGAASGSWQSLENRAYVIKRVLGRRVEKFDKMRFELGQRSILAGLEKRPAAQYIDKDGLVSRQEGWNGHLRWFFPWPEDILPFVILLMLRTGWNLTTATSVRSRRWRERFPFALTSDGRDDYAYVVGYKARGKGDVDSAAKPIKVPSLKRPWSHAYRVLHFVDYLTAGLRREIRRHIHVLELRYEILNSEEQKELYRLRSIVDDLFIYKTEQGISSLRWQSQRTNNACSRQIMAFAARAGVNFNFRDLRDARILHSYEASGQNISVAQIVADHSDNRVTLRYLRRKRTLQRVWHNAIAVFDSSLQLIENGSFSSAHLRSALEEQGFSEFQVGNLLEPGAETVWGNRCADLKHPPEGFSAGHRSGHGCVAQDCIDGCPHARWFEDSVEHVARQLAFAEVQLDQVGLESTMHSSHQSRIDRLRHLLSLWPASQAGKALQAARTEIAMLPASSGMVFTGANP